MTLLYATIVNLVELEDLPCDAVAAHHDGVALGEGQVGHAAKAEADGAVDCGAGPLYALYFICPIIPSDTLPE